ncbi:hypothetical protein VHEMI02325 [[Torrubiella] hemipterigena]|uniref:Uncharacterized protein n=1 Tax=[Torrubiella] hemipterigena TaxID=1531966 RepID=A0A0A1TA64_9HYPO|nr:hypothetical protein VHEMI02325 [[Torrubiella] hemipterigena]
MKFNAVNAIIASLTLALAVAANTEKIIFLAPPVDVIPLASPSLQDLKLDTISPQKLSIQRNLTRVFGDGGQDNWYLLDNLTEGKRYELRVCWAATEPTKFDLDVYVLDTVWETPELISSLAAFSKSQQDQAEHHEPQIRTPTNVDAGERHASVFLLRIRSQADYYSHDKSLMVHPRPVLTDIILDPYLANVVPESLVLTGIHVIVVAITSFFIARWISTSLSSVATSKAENLKKKN